MEKKPLIGITPAVRDGSALALNMCYLDAVEKAGGIPLVLPHQASEETAEQLAELCDGFLFSGGPDVNPSIYGEMPWYELGEVSPYQDATDLLFFKYIIKTGKPVLGICRGIQFLNAALGGTLYQDIGSQFPYEEGAEKLRHGQSEKGYVKTHKVTLKAGSILREVYGEDEVMVNSFHHEAIKVPAPGLTVTAYASDGVIEGVEMPGHRFFTATQWHPEMLAPQCPRSLELFKRFVEASRT